MDDFAKGKFYRVVKDWTIENERMKFAVLTAWINMGRKVGEEFFVDYPADKRRVELRGVMSAVGATLECHDNGKEKSVWRI